MPTLHIPKDTFEALAEQEGGYQAAKDAVKEAAKGAVEGGN